jgi:anti-sigma B factor antagonist
MGDVTELELQTLSGGPRPVVALIGELDINSAPRFKEALATLHSAGATGFVLELSRMTFIDSTGLGAVVAVWNALGSPERGIRLAAPTSAVARAFAITGLAEVFPAFPDTASAQAG